MEMTRRSFWSKGRSTKTAQETSSPEATQRCKNRKSPAWTSIASDEFASALGAIAVRGISASLGDRETGRLAADLLPPRIDHSQSACQKFCNTCNWFCSVMNHSSLPFSFPLMICSNVTNMLGAILGDLRHSTPSHSIPPQPTQPRPKNYKKLCFGTLSRTIIFSRHSAALTS